MGRFPDPLSPDGQFLIIQTDDGLVRSDGTEKGWSAGVSLRPEINLDGTQIGATRSPTGRMFARDTKGAGSGEFFVAHLKSREAWPPVCPRVG